MEKSHKDNNKKQKIILIIISSILLISLGILLYSKINTTDDEKNITTLTSNTTEQDIFSDSSKNKNPNPNNQIADSTAETDEYIEFIDDDSNFINIVDSSTTSYTEPKDKSDIVYLVDKKAGSAVQNSGYKGRRINISITGLDGRLGRLSKHADANHIVSILVNTGEIEIISIPRDTYCDLGHNDSTGLNKLTICRANNGRERYHKELARIAKLNKIDYWVEFGFSQAMAIIEFLGYKEPSNTLQVLRNRKGLGGDDYQRTYSQGQFMRQAILSHFNKFTGTFGSLLVRAGLLLVETNLTADKAIGIVELLEKAKFPQSQNSVKVFVRPPINIAYKVYDFGNEEELNKITKKIEKFNDSRFKKEIENPQPNINVAKKLNSVITQAIADSAKHPTRVISKLSPYFQQRAWYQVKDKTEREKIRSQFGILLYDAYIKKNKQNEANNVKAVIEAEKQLFNK